MGAINQVLEQAVNAAVQVTKHDALTLPEGLVDRVKLLALVDALNALSYALSHSEEAKMLTGEEDKSYLRDVCHEYAKAQVDVQMLLNAISADVKEAA